jgi:WD40 repeat protein
MEKPIQCISWFIFLLVFGVSCTFGGGNGQNTSEGNSPAVFEDDTSRVDESQPLPHTLYYLAQDEAGVYQVWHLERDGITQVQVTFELTKVKEYTVSPIDGRAAYIVENQVYIINPDGSGRTLLIDGGALESDLDHYINMVSGLSWSPDGNLLAFGQNGINLYSFTDDTSNHVLTSEFEELEGGGVYPQRMYFPESWSPDGKKLLVNVSYLEGGTLGTLDLSTGNAVLFSAGIVCCHAAWSVDSSSVFVGSPWLGMVSSGLWRYDISTGAETALLPTTDEDGTLNFAGWPLQLPTGELMYFFNNTPEIPAEDLPLTLVRTASDGISGRVQVRPEKWVFYEVLWAADGSLFAAVVPYVAEPAYPQTGTIVLYDTAGGPPVPLVNDGYELNWGP